VRAFGPPVSPPQVATALHIHAAPGVGGGEEASPVSSDLTTSALGFLRTLATNPLRWITLGHRRCALLFIIISIVVVVVVAVVVGRHRPYHADVILQDDDHHYHHRPH
jgi:hypothetical protein